MMLNPVLYLFVSLCAEKGFWMCGTYMQVAKQVAGEKGNDVVPMWCAGDTIESQVLRCGRQKEQVSGSP